MPELRFNLITGDWVVIAPERAARPHDHSPSPSVQAGPAGADVKPTASRPGCPFCPGNEARSAAERLRVPAQGPWLVRVVDNKYPILGMAGELADRPPVGTIAELSAGHVQTALSSPPALRRSGSGYTRALEGFGRHEVIIDTPAHDQDPARLPAAHLRLLLGVYRDRSAAFYRDPRVEHVIVFKNAGSGAGSSLDHPHSQVVGLPVLPGQVRARIEEALRNYSTYGQCVFCHCLERELAEGARVVAASEHFVAFIPWAALSPYHTWIFPRRHAAYFGGCADEELDDLAGLLAEVLGRLARAVPGLAFNWVLRSLSPAEAASKHFHWYLSIVVRGGAGAGFELGTGMYVNAQWPEESAARLRAS